jgi:hypothetical protein
MAALIISSQSPYTWGQLTNRMVAGMISTNTNVTRLNDAIATASAGFTGTPGTQFEVASGFGGGTSQNLFGVQADADPENAGVKGTEYSYAVGRLNELFAAFWAEAQPFVEQLDNGTYTM